MSKVKIEGNASGSGTLTISAPSTNTDRSLTLPDGAGEILTDASTLSSSNLSGALPAIDGSALTGLAGGMFESYAIIYDRKGATQWGQSSSAGNWIVRDLNYEDIDPDNIVSISNNQFTLGAGTYLIRWRVPCYRTNRSNARLKDTTNTLYYYGQQLYNYQNYTYTDHIEGEARLTISGSTVFQIEQIVEFGGQSQGWTSESDASYSWYTKVEIYKES